MDNAADRFGAASSFFPIDDFVGALGEQRGNGRREHVVEEGEEEEEAVHDQQQMEDPRTGKLLAAAAAALVSLPRHPLEDELIAIELESSSKHADGPSSRPTTSPSSSSLSAKAAPVDRSQPQQATAAKVLVADTVKPKTQPENDPAAAAAAAASTALDTAVAITREGKAAPERRLFATSDPAKPSWQGKRPPAIPQQTRTASSLFSPSAAAAAVAVAVAREQKPEIPQERRAPRDGFSPLPKTPTGLFAPPATTMAKVPEERGTAYVTSGNTTRSSSSAKVASMAGTEFPSNESDTTRPSSSAKKMASSTSMERPGNETGTQVASTAGVGWTPQEARGTGLMAAMGVSVDAGATTRRGKEETKVEKDTEEEEDDDDEEEDEPLDRSRRPSSRKYALPTGWCLCTFVLCFVRSYVADLLRREDVGHGWSHCRRPKGRREKYV